MAAAQTQGVGQRSLLPGQRKVDRLQPGSGSRDTPAQVEGTSLLQGHSDAHRAGFQIQAPAPRHFLFQGAGYLDQSKRVLVHTALKVNATGVHFNAVEPRGWVGSRRALSRWLRYRRGDSSRCGRREPTFHVPVAVTGAHQVETGPGEGKRTEFESPARKRPPAQACRQALSAEEVLVAEARVFPHGDIVGLQSQPFEHAETELAHLHRPAEGRGKPRA